MDFPNINPVLLEFSVSGIQLAITWYALAYVIGIITGQWYASYLSNRYYLAIDRSDIEAFIVWVIIAIIVGGRLGYVIIYHFDYFYHPLTILKTYEGGMSFHGGIAGVTIATYLFCKYKKLPFLSLTDLVCAVAPIGIFLGRIANFINGELYGRPTDVAWAIIFPQGGNIQRHPSQIYEALLEGLLLFILINYLIYFKKALAKTGLVSGIFLIGYALCRSLAECFRQPDEQIGFIGNYTMGQLLSLILLLIGASTYYYSLHYRNKNNS